MKILLTESQYKKLLFENISRESIGKLKSLKDFFKKVKNEAKNQMSLDLGFLVTWGAGIAGFMKPVSDFVEGRYPELGQTDLMLLVTGAILTYFTSTKIELRKVLDLIKKKSLIREFDFMLMKCEQLKTAFLNFIDSLAIPASKFSNMLAYTFIIPILPDLYQIAQGQGEFNLSELMVRILSFIGISYSGILVKRLIQEIVKRFKSR
jgi:hypothetical protein